MAWRAFDEASAISDRIWEVSEGALTDDETEIVWLAFGNPTRNTGRFRECFGRFRHRWDCAHIDSRQVEGTNKPQLDQWVLDYGEDSDFVRVRVKGIFPHSGAMQFISSGLVEEAMSPGREGFGTIYDPLVMGVDVARFGDDRSVIRFRRGRDGRSIPPIKLHASTRCSLPRGSSMKTLAIAALQSSSTVAVSAAVLSTAAGSSGCR